MSTAQLPVPSRPVSAQGESFAWHAIRHGVRGILGKPLADRFEAALRAESAATPASPEEVDLIRFAETLNDPKHDLEGSVERWLTPHFQPEQVLQIVSFAGAVRRYAVA